MREHTLKRWLVAASLALAIPGVGHAAGLGRLTVLSALGQPLNAEVELLSVQKGETLSARLSSVDNYQRANLPFNAALVSARVSVERRPNGTPYVKITTPRPVNEPFAELLVEINSENGRVVRQYTVLLDPPGYGRSAGEIPPPPPVAAPTVRPAPAAEAPTATAAPGAPVEGASGGAVAPAPSAASAPAARGRGRRSGAPPAAQSEAPTAGAKQYGPVKRGETLGRIAKSVQPEGVSLEQTLVGLYRSNPDAFINKNMNLVKSGRILTVPEANEMSAIGRREAAREVKLQVADFNAFRSRLADRTGAASEEGSVTSGRIGKGVAKGGGTEARDTVRLSRGDGKGAKGNAAERVRALEEEAVAREKALADANTRISQLEKTIEDMKRLAQMKGMPPEKGAAPPPPPAGKSQASGPVAMAPVVPPPPAKAQEPAPAPKGAAPAKAPESPPAAKGPIPPKGPEPVPGKAPDIVAKAPEQPAPGKAPEAAKGGAPGAPIDLKGLPTDATKGPGPVAKSDMPPPPPKAKAKALPPPPPPEPDLLDTIMDEPLYLVAGVGVIVLGGLGLIAVARRRRASSGPAELGIAPSTAPGGPGEAPEAKGKRAAAAAAAAATVEPLKPPAAPAASTSPATKSPSLSPEDNDLDFNANMRTVATPRAEQEPRRVEPTAAPTRAPAPRVEPKREEPVKREPVATDDVTRVAGPAHVEPAPRAAAPTIRPSTTGLGAARSLEGGATPPRAAPQPTPAPQPEPAPAARAPEPPRKVEQPPVDLPDFSLEVPPAGSPSQSQSQRSTPAADFNMDFNLEPLPPIEVPGESKTAEGAPAPAPEPAPQSNDLEFKLDDINLDFGAKSAAAAPAKPARDDHWYDVQQKFDLAKAYEEMGDKDGARDILQEVVKEGDADQQAQAKKLLGTLG